MGRTCSTYGAIQKCIQSLVGKPESKRPLGRQRCRWEDIKMDLKEMGSDPRDWIALAEGKDKWQAYVRAVMNLQVP